MIGAIHHDVLLHFVAIKLSQRKSRIIDLKSKSSGLKSNTNALFKTYGTKKETSTQYLHSVEKGGLDYEKKVLNRNNTAQVEIPMNYNYISPYDEMIENNEKIMEEVLKQYEDETDYIFDIKTVDDVTDLKKEKRNIFNIKRN